MLKDELKDIVGVSGWIEDADLLIPHVTEWRDTWRGNPLILVAPDSTEVVSAVVRACASAGASIVPQGGNTGLCGGAITDSSGEQVLLSLSRLNKIRTVDPDDYSLVAEAGCTLQDVQKAAADAGRFFPLSLAAEGSCQIGGNLSTDAGGINVLRYGTARSQALGLEVVLADGTVWNGLRTLRKDTAGFDLKQLFIGAEGTLGIITAASLRIYPQSLNQRTALLAIASPNDAVRLLARLRGRMSDQIQAFELIPDRAVEFVLAHIPDTSFPLAGESPWFVLMEGINVSCDDEFERELMETIESGLVTDVVVAKSQAESDSLWRLRHSISEAQKREGASLKHDISVPVGRVGEFIEASHKATSEIVPGIRPVPFGHVGDGNIHFNLSQPVNWRPDDFLAYRDQLAAAVYDVVHALNGSFSAEHGIGQAKLQELRHYRGETEVRLMKALKTALDPANSLNPGKVI